MDCIAEMISFSTLAWQPWVCLHMHSIAIILKVEVSYCSVCVRLMHNVCIIDIISGELPCICDLILESRPCCHI